MPYPSITERPGTLSAIGIAKEVTFGVPRLPTDFIPFKSTTLAPDPGLFSPQVNLGVRDLRNYMAYGEGKFNGNIVVPLFPVNGIRLLAGAIGQDAPTGAAVAAVTGSPASTTLSASTTAGATAIAVVSSTGITVGMTVVIDPGLATAESLPVTAIPDGTHVTVAATQQAHANAAVMTVSGTTTAGSNPAGGSTINVLASTNIAVGDIIQIDTGLNSELHKVSAVGSGTITIGAETLRVTHAASVPVFKVNSSAGALYTHNITQTNSLPSFTVEKNDGGYQSEQYAGERINKLSLKVPMGNAEAEMTIDLMGQSFDILGTPSPVAVDPSAPFTWYNTSFSIFGGAIPEGRNLTLDIENGLKTNYTYSGAGNQGPGFVTPTSFGATGTFQAVFASLNDATRGWTNKMMTQAQGSLSFTLTSGLGGAGQPTFTVTMPQVNLSKVGTPLPIGDVIMQTLNYDASRNLSAASPATITCQVQNSLYLAY